MSSIISINNRKALVLIAATCLLSLAMTFLSVYQQHSLAATQAKWLHASFVGNLVGVYGYEVAGHLQKCHHIVTSQSILALFITPILALLIGYDSHDRERERLPHNDSCRSPISTITHAALKTLYLVAVSLFLYHSIVWLVPYLTGTIPSLEDAPKWGARLWIAGVLYSMPYIGITVLSSALARTRPKAFLIAVGMLILMWFLKVAVLINKPSILVYLPIDSDRLLLGYEYTNVLQGACVTILWSIVAVAAAVLFSINGRGGGASSFMQKGYKE